jgi:hypothetical protein
VFEPGLLRHRVSFSTLARGLSVYAPGVGSFQSLTHKAYVLASRLMASWMAARARYRSESAPEDRTDAALGSSVLHRDRYQA